MSIDSHLKKGCELGISVGHVDFASFALSLDQFLDDTT